MPTTFLSKSRYVIGRQCHKYLWWRVHEPEAVELQPDKVLEDLFDQGRQVGRIATERFRGGVMIDLPHDDYDGRIAATRAALDAGAPAVFEAAFRADDVFVAVDILLREGDGYRLIEVKSSSKVKDEHLPDVAVQRHVLERSGLAITGTEVMHLNGGFRHPAEGELFARSDVTGDALPYMREVPDEVARQLAVLAGPLPGRELGMHCFSPRKCPFFDRCWPDDRDHIRHLYKSGPVNTASFLQQGIRRIADLPPGYKLPPAARRQIRALQTEELIVEPTLARDLEPFDCRLGYLDFETIARAVPVWDGMRPWGQAAAQFSYHWDTPDGGVAHTAYLAEGPGDARPELAERLVKATADADRVVMYSSFEKTQIRALAEAVPDLREPLLALADKLIDLLPVVRNNVYHPDFRGSFSIKYVLKPLVPGLGYDDLVIVDGRVASVEIARLLFVAHRIPPAERDRIRRDLLDYCERDTLATVELLRSLRHGASC